jgi:membrane associated rhomboid family serine protease
MIRKVGVFRIGLKKHELYWEVDMINILKRNNYYAIQIIMLLNLICYLIRKIFPQFVIYLIFNPVLISNGCFWQFISYMFIHINIFHFIFNMISLYIIGIPLEKRMGSWKFSLMYISCGAFIGILYFIFCWFLFPFYNFWGMSGTLFGIQILFNKYFQFSVIKIFNKINISAYIFVFIFSIIGLLFCTNGWWSFLTNLPSLLLGIIFIILFMKIFKINNIIDYCKGEKTALNKR